MTNTDTISRYDFEAAIELVDYSDIREDYSGRGMYGATCIGIVTDASKDAIAIRLRQHAEQVREDLADLADEADDEEYADGQEELADMLEQMADGMSEDSMGRSGIVYWPRVQFSD